MRLGALLLMMLAAGPVLAEGGPKPAQVKALAQAIAAAGCVVNQDNEAAVLKTAGLTEAEGEAAIDVLAYEGSIKPVEVHVLRLTGREGCE